MLTNISIDGHTRKAFVLKDGDAATVVIPLYKLDKIDYQRLLKLSKQAGSGEMMKVMRDAKLDNGQNALAAFSPVIVVVPKAKKPEVKPEARQSETKTEETKEAAPKRRGPGRPPKSDK